MVFKRFMHRTFFFRIGNYILSWETETHNNENLKKAWDGGNKILHWVCELFIHFFIIFPTIKIFFFFTNSMQINLRIFGSLFAALHFCLLWRVILRLVNCCFCKRLFLYAVFIKRQTFSVFVFEFSKNSKSNALSLIGNYVCMYVCMF